MAVPRGRHTKSRRNKSRMHLFLKGPVLVPCPKCGKLKRPHVICWSCGYYKEKEVVNVLEKLTKKEKKQREKEMRAKEKEGKEIPKEKSLTWRDLSRK